MPSSTPPPPISSTPLNRFAYSDYFPGVITLWSLDTITLLSTLLTPRALDIPSSMPQTCLPRRVESVAFLSGCGRIFACGDDYAAVWDLFLEEVSEEPNQCCTLCCNEFWKPPTWWNNPMWFHPNFGLCGWFRVFEGLGHCKILYRSGWGGEVREVTPFYCLWIEQSNDSKSSLEWVLQGYWLILSRPALSSTRLV